MGNFQSTPVINKPTRGKATLYRNYSFNGIAKRPSKCYFRVRVSLVLNRPPNPSLGVLSQQLDWLSEEDSKADWSRKIIPPWLIPNTLCSYIQPNTSPFSIRERFWTCYVWFSKLKENVHPHKLKRLALRNFLSISCQIYTLKALSARSRSIRGKENKGRKKDGCVDTDICKDDCRIYKGGYHVVLG